MVKSFGFCLFDHGAKGLGAPKSTRMAELAIIQLI